MAKRTMPAKKAKRPPYTPIGKRLGKRKPSPRIFQSLMALSDEKLYQELRNVGLITKAVCSCGHELLLKVKPGTKTLRYKCSRCKSSHCVFMGSLFHGSKCSLRQIVALVFCFSTGKSINDVLDLAEVSETAAVHWFNCFRSLVSRCLTASQKAIGGVLYSLGYG